MSKYTTEVRYICETEAGFDHSVGFKDIDAVLNRAWNKVFTSQTQFYDEAYRPVICKKILKHYYTREIGAEVVGLWKLWMNTKLEEIMPYYNELYKSALLQFDPLKDYDLERTHTRTGTDTKNETGSNVTDSTLTRETSDVLHSTSSGSLDDTTNVDGTSSTNHLDLFSDTPQGGLSGVTSETYLTDARKITDNGTSSEDTVKKSTSTGKTDDVRDIMQSDTGKDTTNTSLDSTLNTTEDYVEHVSGKLGGGTYSNMILDFRKTLLNIDLMVIEEFDDLFMGLW